MYTLLILLCAGRGKRMESITDEKPKALVTVHKKPIVEHTAQSFFATFSDSNLLLISGYKEEKILKWLKEKPFSAKVVFNSQWGNYGPIISADTAMQNINKENLVLLGNGDTLFTTTVFRKLIEQKMKQGIYLIGSKVKGSNQDDMLIRLQDNKVLQAEKRKRENFASEYESSGLIIANGSDSVLFLKQVFRDMAEAEVQGKYPDGPWHDVVQELVSRGQTVSFIEVPNNSWWEFDTQQCIADAELEPYESFLLK